MKFNIPAVEPVEPAPQLRNAREPEALDPDSFPHRTQRGKLPGTIENVRHLLDGYGITARYDLIRKKLIVQGPLWTSTPDNADNVSLTHVISLACLNGLPRGDIEAYVAAVGEANPINPVADWILSVPWDGTDRLPAFYNTLVIGEDYPPRRLSVAGREPGNRQAIRVDQALLADSEERRAPSRSKVARP